MSLHTPCVDGGRKVAIRGSLTRGNVYWLSVSKRMSKKKKLSVVLMMLLNNGQLKHVEKKYRIRHRLSRKKQERGAYNTFNTDGFVFNMFTRHLERVMKGHGKLNVFLSLGDLCVCCIEVLQKCSEAAKRSDNTDFNHFVAATNRRKSNRFEFVRLVAATMIMLQRQRFSQKFPRTHGEICRRDLSPSVYLRMLDVKLKFWLFFNLTTTVKGNLLVIFHFKAGHAVSRSN